MPDIAKLSLEISTSGVRTATEDLNKFSHAAEKAENSSSNLDDVIGSFSLQSLAAAAGVGALVVSLKEMVSSAINVAAEYEMLEANLKVITGSAAAAAREFDDLREMAAHTPFDTAGLVSYATQLQAVGVKADEVEGVLRMLGDSAMGDANKMQRIVQNYAQILSVGKASSMDMRQFAAMGLPVYDLMQKMGIEGNATAEQVKEMFQTMTAEGGLFFGGMEEGARTYQGIMSTLGDSIAELQANLAEDLIPIVEDFAKMATSVLDAINSSPLAQGAIKVAIVALAGAITGFLIPALGTAAGLIASLSFNPVGLAVAGVAAIAALGVEIKKAHDESVALNERVDELRGKLEDGIITADETGEFSAEIIKKIDELKQLRDELAIDAQLDYAPTELKEELARVNSEIAKYEDELSMCNRLMIEQSRTLGLAEQNARALADAMKRYADINNRVNSLYDNSDEGRLKKLYEERQEIADVINKGFKLSKVPYSGAMPIEYYEKDFNAPAVQENYPGASLEKYEKALKGLDEQIAEIENKEGALEHWRILIRDTLNLANDDVINGSGGSIVKNAFGDIDQSSLSQVESLYEALKKLRMEWQEFGYALDGEGRTFEEINNAMAKLQERMYQIPIEDAIANLNGAEISKQYGYGSSRDVHTAKMEVEKAYIDSGIRQMLYMQMNGASEEEISAVQEEIALHREKLELLQKQSDVWGVLGDKMTEAFVSMGASQEVAEQLSDTIKDMAQNLAENTLVSGFEAIGRAMGEGADAGDAMKSVMKDMMTQMLSQISATCIQAGLMMIAQSGWAGLPMALALFALGGVSGIGAGIMGSSNSEAATAQQQQEEQLELLKEINKQYESLRKAIQEEYKYYLSKRRQINADSVNSGAGLTNVNDMILTPNGGFSTHPDDYIIATKNPASLGSSSINVTVNNMMGGDASVNTRKGVDANGQAQLIVEISRKVAQDYANGNNGWDGAIDYNSARRQGRNLS